MSRPTMDLGEIFTIVEQVWHFDVENYPYLPAESTPEEDRRVLTGRVGHVLLHMQKQVGKLAGMVEPLAHGGDAFIPREELARQLAYLVVNAVKLAKLAEVSPTYLEMMIHKYGREHALPAKCIVCGHSLDTATTKWRKKTVHLVCPTYRPNIITLGAHPYLRHIFWQECVIGGVYKFEGGDFDTLVAEAGKNHIVISRISGDDDEFEVQGYIIE